MKSSGWIKVRKRSASTAPPPPPPSAEEQQQQLQQHDEPIKRARADDSASPSFASVSHECSSALSALAAVSVTLLSSSTSSSSSLDAHLHTRLSADELRPFVDDRTHFWCAHSQRLGHVCRFQLVSLARLATKETQNSLSLPSRAVLVFLSCDASSARRVRLAALLGGALGTLYQSVAECEHAMTLERIDDDTGWKFESTESEKQLSQVFSSLGQWKGIAKQPKVRR